MKNFGQRPKVLYVVTRANWGGAQKYVYDLATAISGDFEVAVAAGTEDVELRERLELAGVRFYPIKHLVRAVSPISDLAALFELRALIRSLQPDILHLNSSKAGVVGSVAGWLEGKCKVIFTIHGLVLKEPLTRPVWLLYWLAERLTALFKDLWIAVSEADRIAALHYGQASPGNIKVIPVGLNFARLNFLTPDQARKRLSELTHTNLNPARVIGTIADFYPTKGLPYLISAMSGVITKFPDAHLILIGRGDSKPLRQQIESTGNAQKIHILDNLPEEGAPLLPGLDLFVLASVKEGLPYTLLEAGAAGIPIVATNVGGIPDVIESGLHGILIPPADSEALSSTIEKLLVDPQKAHSMGDAIRERVKQFSLERMIAKTKNLYLSLIA